jgi:methyltransferase (TIGR00027 family)
VLDRPPVFVDALARALLSPEAQSALDADPAQENRGRAQTALRGFLAARSRVAEDCLGKAVEAGVTQYVLLGAGLDTFAYRNPYPALSVFEVDHPRTQAWKRQRVNGAGLKADRLAYVPVDFQKDRLADELAHHGFDAALPTAISWLGVVPYLDEDAIGATLAWAASVVGEEGHIVFDYGSRPRWWQLGQRLALRALAARVAAVGEPFRTLLAPAVVRERLAVLSLRVVDLGARELNARYFDGRTDGLRLAGSGHVAIASRSGRDGDERALYPPKQPPHGSNGG